MTAPFAKRELLTATRLNGAVDEKATVAQLDEGLATKQDASDVLAAISALTAAEFGLSLLELVNVAALRTLLALGIVDVSDLQTALDAKEDAANKGQANGYVPLDGSSKINSAYLPSYVDDVIEAANYAALPGTGETGKIYVTLDTNLTYRWSGSAYVQIATGAVASVAGLTGVISASSLKTALAITVADITNASANGRSLISAADYAAMRGLLSLVPGTNVQAYSATLTSWAGIAPSAKQDTIGYVPEPKGAVTDNYQNGNYTLVLTDPGKLIRLDGANRTLTIPTNASVAIPAYSRIDILQQGTGNVTVAAAGGVTLVSAGSKFKIAAQWSAASLIKIGDDTWVLIGDLTT